MAICRKKTKSAIQDAIDLLHYQPNQIARSLTTKRTNFVGLVIPDVVQPFFATMASRIEDELDRRGYKMILCNTMHSSAKERKYLDMLTANKVDGIIVGSHSVDIDYSGIGLPIISLIVPWPMIFRWCMQIMCRADILRLRRF